MAPKFVYRDPLPRAKKISLPEPGRIQPERQNFLLFPSWGQNDRKLEGYRHTAGRRPTLLSVRPWTV